MLHEKWSELLLYDETQQVLSIERLTLWTWGWEADRGRLAFLQSGEKGSYTTMHNFTCSLRRSAVLAFVCNSTLVFSHPLCDSDVNNQCDQLSHLTLVWIAWIKAQSCSICDLYNSHISKDIKVNPSSFTLSHLSGCQCYSVSRGWQDKNGKTARQWMKFE